MRKQLLASLVAGSILTSGAFAYGFLDEGNANNMNMYGKYHKQMKDKTCDRMGMKNHRMDKKFAKGMHRGMPKNPNERGEMGVMRVFKKLALTQDQKKQVRSIFKNHKRDVVKLSEAFSTNGFDQAKYENLLKQAKDNRFKNQAALIGKVYSVLTDKQKAQFKTLLELHEDKLSLPKPDFKKGEKQ